MNKNEKITLESFVNKALDKAQNKKMFCEIETSYGILIFKRPTQSQLLEYMNKATRSVKADSEGNVIDQDFEQMYEASKEIVYHSCDFLQDAMLKENLDVVNPFEVVDKVFEINEVMEIGNKIIDNFAGQKIAKEIKN